ncbi:hypothetical protein DXG01_011758 [Tephrocybe rancida]|nr:hypothetical protein DXG01_011758 [Tephrocybe rancida]
MAPSNNDDITLAAQNLEQDATFIPYLAPGVFTSDFIDNAEDMDATTSLGTTTKMEDKAKDLGLAHSPKPHLALGTFKADPVAANTQNTEEVRNEPAAQDLEHKQLTSMVQLATNPEVGTLRPFESEINQEFKPEVKAKELPEVEVIDLGSDKSLKSEDTTESKPNVNEVPEVKVLDLTDVGLTVTPTSPRSSKSPSPPDLAFGNFKRGGIEPRFVKMEFVSEPEIVPGTEDLAHGTDEAEAIVIDPVEEPHDIIDDEGLSSTPPAVSNDDMTAPDAENIDIDPVDPDGDEETVGDYNLRSNPATLEMRPAKRPRLFLEAVELPSVETVYGKKVQRRMPPISVEELNKKMEQMQNPKVKKLEGFGLSLDTVRDRLLTVGLDPYPIDLERDIQDVMYKRRFISSLYGGNTQSTLPDIGKGFLDIHGLDDFMYPNLDLNPHAPEMPGCPGLFFGANGSHAGIWDREAPERVITRIRPGIWQYQGQYVLTPAMSLTKEEWRSQKPKAHSAWAKQIFMKDWGRTVRCRVSLRKRLGRPFTEEEFEAAVAKSNKYQDITEDDILQALLRGEEFIAVWTMKCVGYDVEFQRNLAEKYPTWVPPPPKPKNGKGHGKRGVKTRKPKVEHDAESGSDLDPEDSDEDDDDEAFDEVPVRGNSPRVGKGLVQAKPEASAKKSGGKARAGVEASLASALSGKKRKRDMLVVDYTYGEDDQEWRDDAQRYVSRGTRSRPIQIMD